MSQQTRDFILYNYNKVSRFTIGDRLFRMISLKSANAGVGGKAEIHIMEVLYESPKMAAYLAYTGDRRSLINPAEYVIHNIADNEMTSLNSIKFALKQLVFNLVLPLTVISFAAFTKWWCVLPVDAPDSVMSGFPLPYVCTGWHTSMSLQFFLLEFLVDVLVYFLFWWLIIFCIHHFLIPVRVHKVFRILLFSISGLTISGSAFLMSFPEHLFYGRRNFDMEILETGYKFIWQDKPQPACYIIRQQHE